MIFKQIYRMIATNVWNATLLSPGLLTFIDDSLKICSVRHRYYCYWVSVAMATGFSPLKGLGTQLMRTGMIIEYARLYFLLLFGLY